MAISSCKRAEKGTQTHHTHLQFHLTKWIFSAFPFRNRVIICSRSEVPFDTIVTLWISFLGEWEWKLKHSWLFLTKCENHIIKLRVSHSDWQSDSDQNSIRNSFNVLCWMILFFQSATSTNVEGRLIRNPFGGRNTIKWQSSRTVERLQEVVTNWANKHDNTWVDWYGIIFGTKF